MVKFVQKIIIIIYRKLKYKTQLYKLFKLNYLKYTNFNTKKFCPDSDDGSYFTVHSVLGHDSVLLLF